MGQIEQLFFEHPEDAFYLRQVSRLSKVPKTTAARILQEMVKKGWIARKNAKPVPLYRARAEDAGYRLAKRHWIEQRIVSSGLIEHLARETQPKAIVLFGSCAKGEFDSSSDIDLFIQAPEKELDLSSFRLGHRISLFFEPSLKDLSKELLNNIVNGLVLRGYLRL